MAYIGEDMEKFDYQSAIAELESIARKVEDPSTGLSEIDALIRRSEQLTLQCRAWLRGVRDSSVRTEGDE